MKFQPIRLMMRLRHVIEVSAEQYQGPFLGDEKRFCYKTGACRREDLQAAGGNFSTMVVKPAISEKNILGMRRRFRNLDLFTLFLVETAPKHVTSILPNFKAESIPEVRPITVDQVMKHPACSQQDLNDRPRNIFAPGTNRRLPWKW